MTEPPTSRERRGGEPAQLGGRGLHFAPAVSRLFFTNEWIVQFAQHGRDIVKG